MAEDEHPERYPRTFSIEDQRFPFQDAKNLVIETSRSSATVVDLTDPEIADLRDTLTRYLEAG
jgi:hypothetical protein